MITEDQEVAMMRAIRTARKIASPVGFLHALWDTIFEAEDFLRGKWTIRLKGMNEAEAYQSIMDLLEQKEGP